MDGIEQALREHYRAIERYVRFRNIGKFLKCIDHNVTGYHI